MVRGRGALREECGGQTAEAVAGRQELCPASLGSWTQVWQQATMVEATVVCVLRPQNPLYKRKEEGGGWGRECVVGQQSTIHVSEREKEGEDIPGELTIYSQSPPAERSMAYSPARRLQVC